MLTKGAPNLKDMIDLKKAGSISLPLNEIQIHKTLQAFAIVLGVLCGAQSELYLAYKSGIVDVGHHVEEKPDNLAQLYLMHLTYS